jgi:acetoin utilization deacetylase AcuC-like enzyme
MTCHLRDLAARLEAPLGVVLEGGYEPSALADSVAATLGALSGEGEAIESAPEALLTSRAAAGVSRHWNL